MVGLNLGHNLSNWPSRLFVSFFLKYLQLLVSFYTSSLSFFHYTPMLMAAVGEVTISCLDSLHNNHNKAQGTYVYVL